MPLGRFGTDVRGPGVERTLGRVEYDKQQPAAPTRTGGFRHMPSRVGEEQRRQRAAELQRELQVARLAAGVGGQPRGFGAIRQTGGGDMATVGLQQTPRGFVPTGGQQMLGFQGGQQVPQFRGRGGYAAVSPPQPQMDALTQAKFLTAQMAGLDPADPAVQQAALNPEISPARFEQMTQPLVPPEEGLSPRQQATYQYQALQEQESDIEREIRTLEKDIAEAQQMPAEMVQPTAYTEIRREAPTTWLGRGVANLRAAYQPGYQRGYGEEVIADPEGFTQYRSLAAKQARLQELKQQQAEMRGGQAPQQQQTPQQQTQPVSEMSTAELMEQLLQGE